jgi:transposase
MGHDVRLIPPVYVKAFVKRQKNDVAEAEAVAEAAMRPTMRTVSVKTSEQQARAMLFWTRDLLVGQRTQMVKALRGHLAEHGIIVGKGLGNVERLATLIAADDLPELVRTMGRLYLSQITQLHEEVDQIDRRIAAEAKQSDIVRRLQKCQGSDRFARWQSLPSRRLWRHFEVVAILQPGLALSRDSTRAEASKSLAAPRRWANEISEGF